MSTLNENTAASDFGGGVNKNSEQKMTKWGPVLIFIAAMLWASDAPFRFHLAQTLSPSFIVLVEHFINTLIILPFIFLNWQEIRSLNWKQWLTLLGIGIGASAFATILFTQAFSYVNPSVAIVLQKLQPLIAISLAAIFLGERTGKRFWSWALLALAGAYIVSFPGLKPELYNGEVWSPNTIGVLCALGAAAPSSPRRYGRFACRSEPLRRDLCGLISKSRWRVQGPIRSRSASP